MTMKRCVAIIGVTVLFALLPTSRSLPLAGSVAAEGVNIKTGDDPTVAGARRLAAPAVSTSAGITTYLSGCGRYPPVDPGLTIVGDPISSATVSITAGIQAADLLGINPDSTVPCSFDPSSVTTPCGPCPGLAVSDFTAGTITITGTADAATYQACLRRTIFRSTAAAGAEGLGDRLITFSATAASGGTGAGSKTVRYTPADDATCSALIAAASVSVDLAATPAGFYPVAFDASCSGPASPCSRVLLAPYATINAGSADAVGRLRITFLSADPLGGGGGGPYFPAEDAVGFLPETGNPASTAAAPCPGLGYRTLTDGLGRTFAAEIFGPGSAAAYTACARRAYYSNSAAAGTATLGDRGISLRVYAVTTAYSFQFQGIQTALTVVAGDGTCHAAGCSAAPSQPPAGGGGTPGTTLAITTTGGATHYLSACGFFPPVDAGLVVTVGAAGLIGSAAVSITAGAQPLDVLDVDPDPTVPCSFERTCGPCPGLSVTVVGASVSITGAATAAAYQACLRRVIFRSTAFGGLEGLGDRTVTFTAAAGAGSVSASKTVTYDPEDAAACTALLNARSATLTFNAPEGFYPITYSAGCSGGACNAVLLAPFATVTAGSFGVVGRVRVFFDLFTRGDPVGTAYPAEDRMGFLPDPSNSASTPANPCPGLGYRRLLDPTSGAFAGMELFGPGSPALYTACVRRAFYSNIAPGGSATVGLRPTAMRVFAVTTASSEQFSGGRTPVIVVAGACPATGCIAGPSDAAVGDGTPFPAAPAPSAAPSPAPGGGGASSDRALLTWYSRADCLVDTAGPNAVGSSGGLRSAIILTQGQCQQVPDADLGYSVTCSRDTNGQLTGQATVSFCNSGCSYCSTRQIVSANTCSAAHPAYGASGVKVSCSAADVAAVAPLPGDAYIRWIAADGCANEVIGATHMLVPQSVCHFVPHATLATATGYRITCNAAGTSGVFEVCDRGCTSCSIRTPFQNGLGPDGTSQCLPNPAATGSRSVRFQCAPTHITTAGSPSSGGLASAVVTAGGGIAVALAMGAAAMVGV